MASVTFKRTNNIDSVPITDGQLIFDTSDQKIYLDNGNTREVYGGGSGTDLISNVSDATDNNAFNANATVNLFTRKSSIVDTKAEIQSVTQAGVPLGCKGFNEVIGTGDISALGDGSVTGAILANKSAIDTVNQNLTKWNPSTDTLWVNVNGVWIDSHVHLNLNTIEIFKDGAWIYQMEQTPVISDLTSGDLPQYNYGWNPNADGYLAWGWGGGTYSSRQTTDRIQGVRGRTLKVEWKYGQSAFQTFSKILTDDEVYITLTGWNITNNVVSFVTPTTSKQGTMTRANANTFESNYGIALTTSSTNLSIIKHIWIE